MQKKMMALAILTLAGTAMAQPASFTDLGNHASTQNFTQDVTLLAPNDIQWFRVVLPAVTSTAGWVDVWTNQTGDMSDTEIGLYDEFGNGAGTNYSDDDDGDANMSLLTYGSTVARPAIGTGAARDGRDGQLSGGVYYVAVGRYNVDFTATGFGVVGNYTGTQTTAQLQFDIGSPNDLQGTGDSSPGAARPLDSVLYTVTVTPGASPTSTGIAVVGSLTAVGGPASVAFHDDGLNGDAAAGDLVYSLQYTIPAGTAGGNYIVPVTITDAQSRSASVSVVGNVFNPLDLGTLVDGTTVTQQVDVAAFEVKWFKVNTGDCSEAAGRKLTISTFNTPAPNDDSELGLYDASGNLVANNDDREIFAGPARLSFGASGENGDLAAGAYYIALGNFNIEFGATDFGAVADTDIAQTALTHQLDILQQRIVIWSESDNGGDSGDLPATAQIVAGTESPSMISGEMNANDVDMYRINICDAASFAATTVGNGNTADTRLFLFNTDGMGIVYNDDAAGVGGSTVSAASGLIPGNGEYYLAVTRYNIMASDSGGANIWHTGAPFDQQFAPDDAGAANPVAQWTGAATTQTSVNYKIALTGVCPSGGGGPTACSPADVGMAGGVAGQDRLLNNNDFIAFITLFFAADARADLGVAGGAPGHDSAWDNNDFIAFINYFFNDAAACNG